MKILLVSGTTQHGFLLQHLQSEGNEVRFLLPREADHREYENILEKVYTPKEAVDDWKPELVLFDGPGYGQLAKRIPAGVMIVNGGIINDSLASDHAFALSVASRAGVNVVPTRYASDHADASYWVYTEEKTGPKRWSHRGNVYQSGEDLLSDVQEFSSDHPIREEFPGPSYVFAGMYSGKYFCGPPLLVHTEQGLLQHGGLRTEEACTLSPITKSKVTEIFEKMERVFAALRYVGWVFVQMQARPGSTQLQVRDIQIKPPTGFWAAWVGGVQTNVGDILRRLAKEKRFRYSFSEGYTAAVKLTLPPYPYADLPGISRKAVEDIVIPLPNGSERTLLWQQARRNGSTDHLLTTGAEIGYAVVNSQEVSQIPWDLERECSSLREKVPTLQHKANVGDFLGYEIASLASFETFEQGV